MGRVRKIRDEAAERLDQMAKVAKRFTGLKPASEALLRVRAVPTDLIQVDHALGVGGWPVERFTLVHGPSGHGKTSLVLGLAKSFLKRAHYACYIDAERTTSIDWAADMFGGTSLAQHPGFVGLRPDTYEETIAAVREFCKAIADAKDKNELPDDMSGIIIVDSIKKLVPARQMAEIEKGAKGETDLMKMLGMMKAAMNTIWLDELVPILERAGVGMVAIAREMEQAQQKRGKFLVGPNYKLGGGQGMVFDASARIRCERAAYVEEATKEGDEYTGRYYGERIRCTIHKTKLAWREEKLVKCYFHTSNGALVPKGFDHARDVLELGEMLKVVEKNGAWYSDLEGQRIGQGAHNAVKMLTSRPEWLARIEAECRERFASCAPLAGEEEA